MIVYKYLLQESIKKYATIGGVLGGLAGAYYGAKSGEEDVIKHYAKKLTQLSPETAKYFGTPKMKVEDPLEYKVNKGVVGKLIGDDKGEKLTADKLRRASAIATSKVNKASEKLDTLQSKYISARDDKDLGVVDKLRKSASRFLFGKSPAEKEAEQLRNIVKNKEQIGRLNTYIQTMDKDVRQAKMYGAANVGLAGAAAGAAAGGAVGSLKKKDKDKQQIPSV